MKIFRVVFVKMLLAFALRDWRVRLSACGVTAVVLTSCSLGGSADIPERWKALVAVEGEPLPVPQHWLSDAEARDAYSLKLPAQVPSPVPFDFNAAWGRAILGKARVAVQYFDHLCKTEAGQWIFKTAPDVDGLYFARPQGAATGDEMTDPYGPEMPWIQRIFVLTGDRLHDNGAWFVQPPLYNYRFVEQPRRSVGWQKAIQTPYVRLSGYTREEVPVPGVYAVAPDKRHRYPFRDKTPMQVEGVTQLASRYGYTWRGIKRRRDREFGISGGEVLIYDLATKEVLAVRRQFLIAGTSPRGNGKAMWELAARCPQLVAYHDSGEFSQFAFDVLPTEIPSTTRRN